MGNLYVIHAAGTSQYKIGITSRSVADRLKALQTGNPVKLEVVRSYHFTDAARVERELHKRLALFRSNGEWFALPSAQTVDKALEGLDYICTNEIEGAVLCEIGRGSGSIRFDFSMTILLNKDLGRFEKMVMFFWSLFVPGEPIIGKIEVDGDWSVYDEEEDEDAEYQVLE